MDDHKTAIESDDDGKWCQAAPSSPSECASAIQNSGRICATNCGFPIVKRTAKKFGMTEVSDEWGPWTLYWTDRFPNYERCRLMRRHQKTNHIPGILSICRKDELAKNLNRMLKFFPKQYDFFPKTWVLPAELSGLLQHSKDHPNRVFILKPSRGSLGRGIYLTKTIEHLDLLKMMIGQIYIHRPFLIDGFKFDLRMYVLVASCNPLRIYVYNEGLARFATRKYELSGNNLHLKYMHLTNYSVNKNSSTYVIDDNEGSKRKLSTIHDWLVNHNYNAAKVWESIDDVIIKTILTALPHMRYNYRKCFPTHVDTIAGFELLGFDFILDSKLKPYLLEVNHTPSFTRMTQLDREVKDPLMFDVFNMLNLGEDETSRIQEDEKDFLKDRLRHKSMARSMEKARTQQILKQREIWEDEHKGNFRKIFPSENIAKYRPFLKSLLIFSFQKDEFGEVSARKLRKNPYEFSPSETDVSDAQTVRNLLLSSYEVFEKLHMDITNAAKVKLVEEINACRNNSWDLDEKYNALYSTKKSLLSKGMKTVLRSISLRPDILQDDKEKLSSIFLDPPTFLPEDRESCVDLSDEEHEDVKETRCEPENDTKHGPKSHVTGFEELDFIPGVVQEGMNRYQIDMSPVYNFPTGFINS